MHLSYPHLISGEIHHEAWSTSMERLKRRLSAVADGHMLVPSCRVQQFRSPRMCAKVQRLTNTQAASEGRETSMLSTH